MRISTHFRGSHPTQMDSNRTEGHTETVINKNDDQPQKRYITPLSPSRLLFFSFLMLFLKFRLFLTFFLSAAAPTLLSPFAPGHVIPDRESKSHLDWTYVFLWHTKMSLAPLAPLRRLLLSSSFEPPIGHSPNRAQWRHTYENSTPFIWAHSPTTSKWPPMPPKVKLEGGSPFDEVVAREVARIPEEVCESSFTTSVMWPFMLTIVKCERELFRNQRWKPNDFCLLTTQDSFRTLIMNGGMQKFQFGDIFFYRLQYLTACLAAAVLPSVWLISVHIELWLRRLFTFISLNSRDVTSVPSCARR